MATPPVFSAGAVLTAAQMNAVGLWLTKDTTVSAGSSGNIADAFPTDFQNFRIIVNGVGNQTTPTSFYIQLRTAAGSTANTNYFYNVFYGNATAGPTRNYATSQAQWEIGGMADLGNMLMCDITRPNEAATTSGYANGASWGSVEFFTNNTALHHGTATAYTAMTWSVAAGTFTGRIRIYGYRNG